MRWPTVFAEFVLVPILVAAAVWCWHNGIRTTVFAPQGDAPAFSATRYVGPWLAGAAILAIGAGLVAVDVLARAFRRAR
ncbi:hypothetical protein D7D52_06395 [Nocardia yunnanensis]|uniref:Uncharacterized protein n=1 Tax=Nocardia yunnanensis TaxID=2382165 RepID=A0A386ZAA5_9NOCA|nr:hypothetical protein [Nocardia yunnanensis]AYF73545.1 hypothetical protein D7D52_06395 [Nocardia yunnanensis]